MWTAQEEEMQCCGKPLTQRQALCTGIWNCFRFSPPSFPIWSCHCISEKGTEGRSDYDGHQLTKQKICDVRSLNGNLSDLPNTLNRRNGHLSPSNGNVKFGEVFWKTSKIKLLSLLPVFTSASLTMPVIVQLILCHIQKIIREK